MPSPLAREVPHWRETVRANIAVYALTPREADIAWGLFAGLSGLHLADDLGIRWQTVRNLMTGLNRKLGTTDQLDVVLVLLGILPPRYGAERQQPRRVRPPLADEGEHPQAD